MLLAVADDAMCMRLSSGHSAQYLPGSLARCCATRIPFPAVICCWSKYAALRYVRLCTRCDERNTTGGGGDSKKILFIKRPASSWWPSRTLVLFVQDVNVGCVFSFLFDCGIIDQICDGQTCVQLIVCGNLSIKAAAQTKPSRRWTG